MDKVIILDKKPVKLSNEEEIYVLKILKRIREIKQDTGYGEISILIQQQKIQTIKINKTDK